MKMSPVRRAAHVLTIALLLLCAFSLLAVTDLKDIRDEYGAANPGDTITLTDDVKGTDAISGATIQNNAIFINKDITIDGQNHSMTDTSLFVYNGATLTLKNVSISSERRTSANAYPPVGFVPGSSGQTANLVIQGKVVLTAGDGANYVGFTAGHGLETTTLTVAPNGQLEATGGKSGTMSGHGILAEHIVAQEAVIIGRGKDMDKVGNAGTGIHTDTLNAPNTTLTGTGGNVTFSSQSSDGAAGDGIYIRSLTSGSDLRNSILNGKGGSFGTSSAGCSETKSSKAGDGVAIANILGTPMGPVTVNAEGGNLSAFRFNDGFATGSSAGAGLAIENMDGFDDVWDGTLTAGNIGATGSGNWSSTTVTAPGAGGISIGSSSNSNLVFDGAVTDGAGVSAGSTVPSAPSDPASVPGYNGFSPLSSVVLDQNSAQLDLATSPSITLSATLAPSSATEGIKWASSDETVATVDAGGNVTALSAGTATIFAEAKRTSGVFGSCAVTVQGGGITPPVAPPTTGETGNSSSSIASKVSQATEETVAAGSVGNASSFRRMDASFTPLSVRILSVSGHYEKGKIFLTAETQGARGLLYQWEERIDEQWQAVFGANSSVSRVPHPAGAPPTRDFRIKVSVGSGAVYSDLVTVAAGSGR